jgi:hypothetical protein
MLRATRAYAETQATKIVASEPAHMFVPLKKDDEKWQAVQNYLTKTRGLPENFLTVPKAYRWIFLKTSRILLLPAITMKRGALWGKLLKNYCHKQLSRGQKHLIGIRNC